MLKCTMKRKCIKWYHFIILHPSLLIGLKKKAHFKLVFFCRGGPYLGDPSGELRNWGRDSEIPPGADGLGSRTHGPRSVPDIDRTTGRV